MRAETRGKQRKCKPRSSGDHRPLRIAEDGAGHRAGGLLRVAARRVGVNPAHQSPYQSRPASLGARQRHLAEIQVPQNASSSETTDYLMPYGILRSCPLAGMLVAQLLEIPVGRRPFAVEQSRY